jgi:integrase
LRPRNYEAVERHLMRTAKPLHRMSLAKVDRRAIAALLTRIATASSDATANRTRSSLSGLFAFAIREGLTESNPTTGTENREEVARDRLLTDAEIAAIWSALGDDDYSSIVRLLILLGGRRAEIGNLKWTEVDLDRGLISLSAERTKSGKPHVITLSAAAADILKARPQDRGQVFGRGKAGFNSWGDGRTKLDRDLEAAGVSIQPWVLHDFRRYVSTAMHERFGILPHVVESVLGHVGHQAGVAGRYNRSLYLAEKARALAIWADHIMAITGNERKVVPLHVAHAEATRVK